MLTELELHPGNFYLSSQMHFARKGSSAGKAKPTKEGWCGKQMVNELIV